MNYFLVGLPVRLPQTRQHVGKRSIVLNRDINLLIEYYSFWILFSSFKFYNRLKRPLKEMTGV